MEYWKCKICDCVYTQTEIDNAVRLSRNRSGKMVKLADGSIHDVYHLSSGMHERWHTVQGSLDCWFCKLEHEALEQKQKDEPQQQQEIPKQESGSDEATEDVHTEPEQSVESAKATLRWAFRNINAFRRQRRE